MSQLLKMARILPLMAAAALGADLTGHWTGTFQELAQDGSVRNTGAAYMVLKLSANTVTGTAGPSESQQREIANGKLDGRKLTFDLQQPQGPLMKFDLTFDGDTIKGNVAGDAEGRRMAARVELKRKPSDRPEDREAIRAHIDRIFQGFIHKDRAELRATHAENWLGYLEGSGQMIHGVDGYMEYGANVDPNSPYGMTGYTMREFDMIFHGDAAFVSFVADVEAKTPDGPFQRTLRITDFYTKQNGGWIQSGSNTDLHPRSTEERFSAFRTLYDSEKKSLLEAREAVWRAWFGGD
ncbi:MAG: nuclear transport factor 2 family protein, partial [Gemmatimonadetes bacterium]|nr:nuclear transport factor 2 family protein [Gemmatimonadota bacterium]